MIGIHASVLVASLVGSLHCAGMCGPLAAFCGGAAGSGSVRLREAAYHGARLVSYSTLGAVAGALGARLDGIGMAVGLGRLAGALAGATMLVWAAALLFGLTGTRLGGALPRAARSGAAAALRRLRERPPLARAALLGVGSALLPCGWLYAFVLVAAGTGSVLDGLLTMIAFWLGTVPALVFVSLGARVVALRLGRRLPALGAAALLVVGLTTVVTRAEMRVGQASNGAPASTDEAVPTKAPCHGH